MENDNKRIAMIICYMGKLPWYFDYFAHSCGFNLDIDFYIITDDKSYKKSTPKNMHFIHKTLDEINKIATERLGFETHINNGYKLCDFKPAYGFLFPEIIKNYDFWGHGDLDIIYGNIRKFIDKDVLENNDIIAVRDDFLTGYFLLFRNNKTCNHLFMKSKDYKKVFSDSKHYCFDETNFNFLDFERGMHYSQVQSEVESMTHIVKKCNEQKIIRAYFDFHVIEGAYGKLLWENGRLTYDNNRFEAMLYHLILFKNIYNPKKSPRKIPNKFRISKTKIY